MPDGADEVLEAVAQQIEERFRMSLPQLRRAAAAAPDDHQQAAEVLRWYGHLQRDQAALEQSEDALLDAIGPVPGELSDAQMALAHRVNVAAATRDGRAMVVRHLLDPEAAHTSFPDAWRFAARSAGRPSASTTSPAVRPAAAPPGAARGRTR
ncbi:hypothetical protein DMH18_26430 [Streptomyces sp. WAC 06783]|uniref:hypothetical protein n=1 Tax=Streptomyces sp. WAC 06783 TaxID=2203211 RepID=UPI000F73E1CD|nr:hypothetical protein [Streptomyces sp. WAC 06783]RSO06983.1 hypothetical protein DMH18_26430 [Streptomyces sp. WAC 06783]